MSSYKIISGVSFLAVLFGLLSSFFTVDQTQQALILQFGEPKRLINKPGLNFKIPFIQEVTYFDKRVLSLVSKDSEEVILADQKRLEVDTYSRFKIIDPLLFFQTVRSEFGARQRLESIIDSSVRRVFGKFELTAILSDARTQIVDDISGEVNSTIKKLGMEIVERQNHSIDIHTDEHRDSPLGADAAIAYPFKDLRIRNNHDYSFCFRFQLLEDTISFTVEGTGFVPKQEIVYQVFERGAQKVVHTKNHHNELVAISVYRQCADGD